MFDLHGFLGKDSVGDKGIPTEHRERSSGTTGWGDRTIGVVSGESRGERNV